MVVGINVVYGWRPYKMDLRSPIFKNEPGIACYCRYFYGHLNLSFPIFKKVMAIFMLHLMVLWKNTKLVIGSYNNNNNFYFKHFAHSCFYMYTMVMKGI